MANAYTTSFTHTFAGDEFLTELFYKPEVAGDEIFEKSFYRFMDVPRGTENIYLPNKLRKITKKYTDCGRPTPTATATVEDKSITVNRVRADLDQCAEAFYNTALEAWIKKGNLRHDLSGTDIETMVTAQYRKAIQSDIGRMQWFASTDVTSTDWNQFDGWIHLSFENSSVLGGYYNLQTLGYEATTGVLATDGALNAFKHFYANKPDEFDNYENEQIKIMVSAPVWNNYLSTLSQTNIDMGWATVQDGKQRLFFYGIEVVKVKDWNTNLTDSTNPYYSTIGSNLIYITVAGNLVVGADISDPKTQFSIRYDENDELQKWTGKWRQGAQIVHEEVVVMYY